MKRIVLALVASGFAAAALLSSSAAASGPAPPGKEIVEIECEGIGSLTVSVARNEHGKGAGQIVGQKGHGIPVSLSFSLTDVTTGEPLFSETELQGGGNAHHNQNTTTCKGTNAEVPASIFFGEHELPPGVSPEDIIRAAFEVQVIVKL
ncbi:MAG: hypothetical protein E6G34_04885 [Actinobacteria bacterium]|nr:MAG: hypothetical protein E6G34_04885 [Actinomycetota bacterium]